MLILRYPQHNRSIEHTWFDGYTSLNIKLLKIVLTNFWFSHQNSHFLLLLLCMCSWHYHHMLEVYCLGCYHKHTAPLVQFFWSCALFYSLGRPLFLDFLCLQMRHTCSKHMLHVYLKQARGPVLPVNHE